ncbi:MAG: hypothetical protein OK455_07925, partial [Thaumarchaeota archaeon]|nr:hypothetical protein [Nitrososphaerota archaeon]
FVDQLREIQGEYLMLSELYQKERSYGERLANTMRLLQYEVDVTIPLDTDILMTTKPLKEAFLASESVVVMIDNQDNKLSRPLNAFPPEVILAIIQYCTPELKRLITEKRRNASNKVYALEKVLKELKKAQATFKQTKKDSVDASESDETEESKDSEEEIPAQMGEPNAEVEPAPVVRSKVNKEETFAFRGSYLERKDAAERMAAER